MKTIYLTDDIKSQALDQDLYESFLTWKTLDEDLWRLAAMFQKKITYQKLVNTGF